MAADHKMHACCLMVACVVSPRGCAYKPAPDYPPRGVRGLRVGTDPPLLLRTPNHAAGAGSEPELNTPPPGHPPLLFHPP